MPDAYHLDLRNPAACAAPIVTHNTIYNVYGAVGAVGPGATANGNVIIAGARADAPNNVQTIWTAALEEYRTTWKCKAQRIGLFSVEFLPNLSIHLDHEHLRRLVLHSQTKWGGWSLPTFTTGNTPHIQNRVGLIEGTYSRGREQEVWQLHDSGEFMLARKLRYEDDRGRKFIPYEDVVHGVAMSLVFAQRLYAELALSKSFDYRFALVGVRNHVLGTVRNREVGANPSETAGEDVIHVERSLGLAELNADWRSVVLDVTNHILRIFNAVKSKATIDELLEKFIPTRKR